MSTNTISVLSRSDGTGHSTFISGRAGTGSGCRVGGASGFVRLAAPDADELDAGMRGEARRVGQMGQGPVLGQGAGE